MPTPIRCHYDVLGVATDADAATIKKHHRRMALRYHPDKNVGDDTAAEKFRLVQQAYECLSDPRERRWYDEHRDAILAGWSAAAGSDLQMLFDVVPYMHPGCHSGYHDGKGGFYDTYSSAFAEIVQCEMRQSRVLVDLPTDLGSSDTEWSDVVSFYQHWESFGSVLNFAWEDKYNSQEDGPNRRVRRLMDDENRKARRAAKKTYNQDILALVSFVKRRDPRVQAKKDELEREKAQRQRKMKEEAAERKAEQQKAKQEWLERTRLEMEAAEEEDRLAGRIRLADLDDDYDYGGGGKKKKRNKKKKKGQNKSKNRLQDPPHSEHGADDTTVKVGSDQQQGQTDTDGSGRDRRNGDSQQQPEQTLSGSIGENDAEEITSVRDDDDDDDFEGTDNGEAEVHDDYPSSSESEEPDIWRCECCKKDFKSQGQMENHMKSKKHKEKAKKYAATMKKKEEAIMNKMMNEVMLDP